MKVLVAGATGAMGKQLVPRLVAHRHDVVGITRTPAKQESMRALGARPIVADALDPDQVARAVADAEPDVIVHQLTVLSGSLDLRHAISPPGRGGTSRSGARASSRRARSAMSSRAASSQRPRRATSAHSNPCSRTT